jgi:hypothetical protein
MLIKLAISLFILISVLCIPAIFSISRKRGIVIPCVDTRVHACMHVHIWFKNQI